MGTSSAYRGSTSKVSRELREGIDDWVESQSNSAKSPIPARVVAQALKIPRFPRQSAKTGGSENPTGGSRKQSSPQRNARTYAATASHAANLARAFREGDRATLANAGLDFDRLSALPSRAEMVRAILDVVCSAQSSSDIPSEEQRDIAGQLLEWLLDSEQNPTLPTAAATAEQAISLIIAEIFLSESGEFTSTEHVSREDFVEDVYEASQFLASRANLSVKKASQEAISGAIERGLKFLRRAYKGDTE